MTTQVALDTVPPLTDTQRDQIRAHYTAHPDSGYKTALLAAGIKATRAAAKRTIEGDDELADVPRRALKIDTGSAMKAIGEILADKEHKDRLRAATFVLAALDGVSEKTQVEVTGAGGGPLQTEDRSATLGDVARVLHAVGAFAQLSGGAPQPALPSARPVLPDPSDG